MTAMARAPRAFLARDSAARRPDALGLALAAATVLLAIATVVGFFVVRDNERADLRSRLHDDATDAANALQQLTTGAAVAPAAIAGLFVGVGPERVTDTIFAEFAAPLLDTEAVTALEWIPRVTASDVASYQQFRQTSVPGFALRQFTGSGTFGPASGRSEYFPVAYVEPLAPNRAALGVDLGSEATRAAALETARDTGAAAATAPIRLAQGGTGILVFYPAYGTEDGHDTVDGRRRALVGFGLAVLRPAILLERATNNVQFTSLTVALYDRGSTASQTYGAGSLIAAVGPGAQDATPAIGVDASVPTTEIPFDFADRHLALVAAAAPGYASGAATGGWFLLFVGGAAVLLLIAYSLLRRRTDLALQASAARLRSVVEASPDAFLGLDEAGVVIDTSPQAEQMLGRSRAALLGRRIDDLIAFRPTDDDDEADDEDDAAPDAGERTGWVPPGVAGATVHVEGAVTRDDGDDLAVEVTMAGGQPRSEWPVACFVRDVTESVNAREERARAGRLEALGQLAAGVAHDVRNTLWGIELVVTSLRSKPTHDAMIQGALAITDAVERGNALANQLLEFARPRLPTGEPLVVGEVVQSLAPMLDHLLGAQRVLAVEVDDGGALVMIERGQLQTVLINLVANARDAMPDAGRVRITVDRATLSVADADDLEITPGEYVTIWVADSGTGMAPTVARRIFEPYFTTKAVGKGTGLGLATAYGTIRGADGAITVDSRMGAGTTFRILLPVYDRYDPVVHALVHGLDLAPPAAAAPRPAPVGAPSAEPGSALGAE